MRVIPERAAVRPRVISPERGEPMLLEQAIRVQLDAGAPGAIYISGACGAGKTTALRHLAAELGPSAGLKILDEPTLRQLSSTATRALVVYGAVEPRAVKHLAQYRLAGWEEDDLIEYLLAQHRPQCAAVMARVRAATDFSALRASPELWRIVLDQMATDPSIRDVTDALHRHLDVHLTEPKLRRVAGVVAWNAELAGGEVTATALRRLRRHGASAAQWRLAQFPAFREILAAERVVEDLSDRAPCRYLAAHLPRSKIGAAARELWGKSAAIGWLLELFQAGDEQTQPTIASLLLAADPEWAPPSEQIVSLTRAYLANARWSGLNLAAADLRRADLRGADLTLADLSQADARGTRFGRADFHGAVLRACRATAADFGAADLSFVLATGACFERANLGGADLEGALLEGASLEGAHLAGARFVRAHLARASLLEADIDEADFSGASLEGANLRRLKLHTAMFAGACLAGAALRGCELEHFHFSSCAGSAHALIGERNTRRCCDAGVSLGPA